MLFRYPFVAMGSGCEILVEGERSTVVKSLVESALTEIHRLEQKYSFYHQDSLLSQINTHAHKEPVIIDEETEWLLDACEELHQSTSGRFDPTIGSVAKCWDFREMRLPSATDIAEGLKSVGWNKVEYTSSTVRLAHPETQLDFGGIVKEYAIDCAVGILTSLGVTRGLVNLGGDLRTVGRVPQDYRAFSVGIAHPRRHHDTAATLALRQGAVVSSGDYQRYFLRDGKRYHHLLDPSTGEPLELLASSVTSHAETAVKALVIGKQALFARTPDDVDQIRQGLVLICDEEGDPRQVHQQEDCRVVRIASERAGGHSSSL